MNNKQGFTLVELSIVLVILGLLVGGVLSGQSLIRAAELRAIATEKDKYIVALNAFKDKYFALPGDMKNAFAFWGTDCGTDTDAGLTGCNGDGDGFISNNDITESVKAWEHLSRAGLIEGNFDGTGTMVGGDYVRYSTTNTPTSKFSGGNWLLHDESVNIADVGIPPVNHAHLYLTLAGLDGASVPFVTLSSLTNGEAWNLDTKMDDGRSRTGTMRGDSGADCTDSGTDYYLLSAVGADKTAQCILWFILK